MPRDILKIVQGGKEIDPGKAADPGNEGEVQIMLVRFQNPVEFA